MTVKELIEELQRYPDEMKVILRDGDYHRGVTETRLIDIESDEIHDEYEYGIVRRLKLS